LNGTHQFLAYTHDDGLPSRSSNTIEKNTEFLLDASKEVDL